VFAHTISPKAIASSKKRRNFAPSKQDNWASPDKREYGLSQRLNRITNLRITKKKKVGEQRSDTTAPSKEKKG